MNLHYFRDAQANFSKIIGVVLDETYNYPNQDH